MSAAMSDATNRAKENDVSHVTYAIIDLDGTSYLVEASGPGEAVEIAGGREGGTDVEDALGIELPRHLQGEASGESQAWLAERAIRAGYAVIETGHGAHRVVG